MQQEFQEKYDGLNPAQKRAVNRIEGPLLVLAGPGTGKTELLSLRAANILRQTDADPGSILCLTFTESAQANMQARLGRLIGPQASQVAIHTFHSFGSHIIGTHSDYFQEAFGFRPSDDVTRYQLLANILERLPRDMRLSTIYDGQFLYLKDIQSRISQLKQAGLSPAALKLQVAADKVWVKQATTVVRDNLANFDRISAKEFPRFAIIAAALSELSSVAKDEGMVGLGQLCAEELELALEAAGDKLTKPLTQWKSRWLTKNGRGDFMLSADRQLAKLAELADIYQAYQTELAARRLYDYDDMIVRVIDTLAQSPDLRAELQERYQYIMVDEYQDTNGAQLRLLRLLADSPVNEGQPNLMVVGDDDQAVYGFQGAYQSNVKDFLAHWPAAKREVLTRNYRSTAPILQFARQLIVQGEDRLENSDPLLNKTLVADDDSPAAQPTLELLPSQIEQFGWLAGQIKAAIKNGQNPRQIAIIAPKHKYLESFVPYLEKTIAVAYERRENVLQQPHIVQLLTLARVITHLAAGEISAANHYLPELLSYPWWNIDAGRLWEVALEAKKSHELWLEIMRDSKRPELRAIATWLLEQAKASQVLPLEPMMDVLIGSPEAGKEFDSPYRRYYFDKDNLDASVTYLRLLSGLVSLRSALREYQPDKVLDLSDFVAFADLRLQAKLPLRNDHPLVLDVSAIQLLTAHKAKGLEFEQVFLINADEYTWRQERGRSNNIALPPNYAVIAPSGDTADEKLRLLYVAATRARKQLTLTSFATTADGKPTLPLGWLQPEPVRSTINVIEAKQHAVQPITELTEQLGFDWLAPHFELRSTAPWHALLQADLEHYQLSPTHLTAFLNVGRGGPKAFLVNQLLRFPQALSVSAQFGNVMHKLLERLHGHVNAHGKLPMRHLAETWLDVIIAGYYFGPIEEPKAQRRGRLSLDAIYQQLATGFQVGQQTEYDFAGEGVIVGEARLKGKIDMLTLDKQDHKAIIIDYKTGSAIGKWPTTQTNSYEAHKAHRYRQQLAFYKLLVEGSHAFHNYQAESGKLVFVEPDEDGQLRQLEMSYDSEEMDRLSRLIQVVYQHIIALDLPDTSGFSQDYHGTLAFEASLLGESQPKAT